MLGVWKKINLCKWFGVCKSMYKILECVSECVRFGVCKWVVRVWSVKEG